MKHVYWLVVSLHLVLLKMEALCRHEYNQNRQRYILK